MIDTHVHLNDPAFEADRGAVLDRALEKGVRLVVEIADSPDDWDKAMALSRSRPGQVRCSLGLHPYYADRWEEVLRDKLFAKSRMPEVVAVGEIGLDYAKCSIPADIQRASFLKMVEAAWECRLPVVIHCREAYRDMMPILEDFYRPKTPAGRFHGVLHCFSGGLEEARRAAALGFALGVDGPVTYPKNEGLRFALKEAGLDRLVLETDSPYLPPQSSRGKRNEPGSIPEIAAKVAEVFGMEPGEVVERTSVNARALYKIS